MRVYLGLHPRVLLPELAHYADALIMIADKSFRTGVPSIDRVAPSMVKPNKSYAHAVMSSDDNDQKHTSDMLSKLWDHRYDDIRQSSPPPSSNKISYCRASLEKTHSILQCSFVSRQSDLLQKKDDNFMTSDGSIGSYQ